VFFNGELPLDRGLEVYFFGGPPPASTASAGFFRAGDDARSRDLAQRVPAVIQSESSDVSFGAGVKAKQPVGTGISAPFTASTISIRHRPDR